MQRVRIFSRANFQFYITQWFARWSRRWERESSSAVVLSRAASEIDDRLRRIPGWRRLCANRSRTSRPRHHARSGRDGVSCQDVVQTCNLGSLRGLTGMDVAALIISIPGWLVGVAGYLWILRERQRKRVYELRRITDGLNGKRTFTDPPAETGAAAWGRASRQVRVARQMIRRGFAVFPTQSPGPPDLGAASRIVPCVLGSLGQA